MIKKILSFLFGRKVSSTTKSLIQKTTKEAKAVLKNNDSYAKKSIIISLDSTLGKAYSDLYGKASVGQNLKTAKKLYSYNFYQSLWEAHKIRNRLAHEPDYKPRPELANEAIEVYINALKRF